MGRLILILFGLSSVAWGLASLFMPSIVTKFQNTELLTGDANIEFLAVNAGLWPAVGVLCLIGAALKRMRVPALVTMIVCVSGMVGGRILGLVQGHDPGIYSYVALGLETSVALVGAVAFGVEKTNFAEEAADAKKQS